MRQADDFSTSELVEIAPDVIIGRWSWFERTDGGVIGELLGTAWTVSIQPLLYGGTAPLTTLRAYDASGSFVTLDLGTSALDTIVLTPDFVPPPPDSDGDAVADADDNCLLKFNPDQIDTDADGCGNQCDADFTQDGTVGSGDFFRMAGAYGSLVPPASPNIDVGPDPPDGVIGAADFFILGTSYGGPPGPSGTTSGTTACP